MSNRRRIETAAARVRLQPVSRVVLALGVLFGLLAMGLPATVASGARQAGTPDTDPVHVERAVTRELADKGTADFWVVLEERADLSAAQDIDDWVERGQYVYDELTATASKAQTELIAELTDRGVRHEAFHIVNAVRVTGGDQTALDLARSRPEVEAIVAPTAYAIPEPIEGPDRRMTPDALEWGIANIRANEVWDTFGVRGEGIVIANIDTGVQFDHPVLVNQYRGNNGDGTFTHDYNWFDATGACPAAPCDSDQHGTHTMGTMVGDDAAGNQIGVAPGATWIAANGCCPSDAALFASAQWMLAPTNLDNQNPDVGKRPHIINNSWGTETPTNDPFMEDILIAWDAAGIFGMWSNGNNGPACATSGSPGSRIINYSAGAYDSNNTIANFSSRGAGQDGEIKPNIAAPGVNVRSSVPGNGYANFDGTSMASPHVAGAIALVWSASPTLLGNPADTKTLLDGTARDVDDTTCGGTADDNNVYGEGRLDAFAAVDQSPRGPAGALSGKVTDSVSGAGLGGITVTATGDDTLTTSTRTDGTYRLRLPVGTYEISAEARGYFGQPAHDVEIVEDQTTTRDFSLDPVPALTVSATSFTSWQLPGDAVAHDLTIGNEGAADLAWNVDQDGSDCGTTGSPSWATLDPATGSVAPDAEQRVSVVFDSTDLADGELEADVCLVGNDPKRPLVILSLTLVVDETPPEDWVQRDKVRLPVPAEEYDGFGWKVDVDGDTAVVLACGAAADGLSSAFVYTRTADGVWREQATLTPSAPAAGCGRDSGLSVPGSVAVDGDTVVLGLPIGRPDFLMGTVTVFARSGDDWTEQAQLSGAGYGFAVAVDGDTLFTSASPDWNSFTYHVFGREGGEWSKQSEFVVPEGVVVGNGPLPDIVVDGDTAVVNAVRFADTPAGHYAAAIFSRNGEEWTLEAELAPSDGAEGLDFAQNGVSLNGDTVVVTASGPGGASPPAQSAAYVFTRTADGWHEQTKLTQPPRDPGHGYGAWTAPAVDGDLIAVGEQGFGAHLWNRVGEGWRYHDTLVPAGHERGSEVGEHFGQGVSLDGDALVASTLPETGNGNGYVFDTDDPSPTVGLAPRAADFGGVTVGELSDSNSVTLENNGSADMQVGDLALVGDHPADFLVTDDDCSGQVVEPGRECTFAVSFAPGVGSLGQRSAQVDLPSNALTAPDTVSVTGVGVPAPPAIDVLPGRFVAEAAEGSRLTRSLLIANRGTSDLEWSVFPDPTSTETLTLRPVGKTTVVPGSSIDLDRVDLARLSTGDSAGAAAEPPPPSTTTEVAPPGTVTMSHSRSFDVLRSNTVRCGYTDLTTAANRFLRTFTLSDFGVKGGLEITEVAFGVEAVSAPVDVTVNIYWLVGELSYANLDRLATETVSLQPQTQTMVTVPINAAASPGSTLVMEVAAPDMQGVGSFVAGSNQGGESAPSYLAAPDCGVTEPTPYSRLDFADSHPIHLVMTMSGRVECGTSWLEVNPDGGTVPGDDSQLAEVTFDTAGLAPGEHAGNLCLASNDPRRPLTTVPVALQVTEAPPVTFDSLRDRVVSFRAAGDVTPTGASRLLAALAGAERRHDRGQDIKAVEALEQFQKIANDDKYVPSSRARDALIADAEQLIAQLREQVSDRAITAPYRSHCVYDLGELCGRRTG